ncbi:hypothetical protein DY218_27370 [Streptomyces triticagri]|uniref:Uncharacterized protein n=1 Tax=Streptomyces triticagri TaxID=2293568 RepID=A0A372LZ36_9ACTN|nr:hypothetical protein [Streptomyces triticagri]RFU83630.1 hypothetical protein DY218_27370 [Streptomyces triticagri]
MTDLADFDFGALFSSHERIRDLASAARTKWTGRTLRFPVRGGEIHAVEMDGDFQGERAPRPACHRRPYVLATDARASWMPVTCSSPGCRERQGQTGDETAFQDEVTRAKVAFRDASGNRTVMLLTDAVEHPLRRDELRRTFAHPLVVEFMRRWDAEHGTLQAYADTVTADRAVRTAAAEERGMLFDVA